MRWDSPGAVVIAPPAPEGRRACRAGRCSGSVGRRPRRGAGPGQPRRPPAGRAPGRIRSADTTRPASPASRSTAPPPAGWASPPRPAAASHRTTRCSKALKPAGLPGHPLSRRLGHRLHRRSERVLLEGQALTERQGADARGGHDPLRATAACWTPNGNPHLFDRGRCWWARASRYDTCRRRGVDQGRPDQLHRGLDRLVPAGQRGAGFELQPDLRRLERDHQLRPARRRTTTSRPAR